MRSTAAASDIRLEGLQPCFRHLDLGFDRWPGRVHRAAGLDLAALAHLEARIEGHGGLAVHIRQRGRQVVNGDDGASGWTVRSVNFDWKPDKATVLARN